MPIKFKMIACFQGLIVNNCSNIFFFRWHEL